MKSDGCSTNNERRSKGGSMTTEALPLFLRFLNAFWEQVKISIHRLSEYANKACSLNPNPHAALNELSSFSQNEENPHQNSSATLPSKRNTQWVWAEKTGTDKKRNVMMVEVEYFNDTHIADLHSAPAECLINNYTIDGEDPNLRITHYPPSNRVH